MAKKAHDIRFLLYSINYAPELTGIGKYNGEMAEWLVESGSRVDVVCSQPHYPEWKVHKGYSKYLYRRSIENGVNVTRCPTYIPSHPHVIKRLVHLVSFALSSSISIFGKFFRKPDVVFVVQPTLFCAPIALIFGKLVGARTVLHIQDYEIDAMFGLGMAKSSNMSVKLRLAKMVEKFIMRRFDVVSTISHSMIRKARDKGVDPNKLIYFPNWTNTNNISPYISGELFRQKWGVNNNQKMIVYAGNIGAKQGLEILIQAAEQLSDMNLKIFIVGEGAHSNRLKRIVAEKNITNLEFKSLVPLAYLPSMLAAADVHVVIQRKGAADVVMPSKLTNILAAGGHAVVTACQDTELGRIAESNPGLYCLAKPEDSDDLVKAICKQLDVCESQPINNTARAYAEKYIEQSKVLERFKRDVILNSKTSNQGLLSKT